MIKLSNWLVLTQNKLAERWLNLIRYRVTSPQFIISILLLIALFYLVVVPLYGIVERTLTWDEADIRMSRDAVPGQHTLFHWKNVLFGRLAKKFFYEPLMHALFTGSVAAVLPLLVDGILSLLVTRTDMPGKRWLRPVLTIPYIIPSFAIALAWGTFFRSPKVGGHQGLFEVAFGVAPPAWRRDFRKIRCLRFDSSVSPNLRSLPMLPSS